MYSLEFEIKEIKLTREIEPVITMHIGVEFPRSLENFEVYNARVFDMKGVLCVSIAGQPQKQLGLLLPRESSIQGGTHAPRMSMHMTIYVSERVLEHIEAMRAGNDLYFSIYQNFISGILTVDGKLQNQQQLQKIDGVRLVGSGSGQLKYPKSDWVTDFSNIDMKKIRIFEFPTVEGNDIWDLAKDVDLAWKKYYSGEYNDAVTQCRKICEIIKTKTIELGFVKESNENGNRNPDWKKLIGHDTLGENFTKLFTAVWGLTQPSAHVGVSFDKNIADLVLFTTHAIVNYVVKIVSKLPLDKK